MFIKCPKCSTGYNIPDSKLSDKPTKMRCSRCKTVFAITRRGGSVPAGYEEFTGRQSALPGEFAFLKHSTDEPKETTQTEAVAPQPPSPPPTPQAAMPAPTVDEDIVQKAIKEVEDRAKRVKEIRQAEATAQSETPAATQEQVQPPSPAPEPPPTPIQVVPESGPARQPVEQVEAPRQSAVSDIYGGSQSAWEIEAPLELGSYVVETSSTGQKVGKIMFVITALIAAFLIYVAYRNGWSLSFANLGEQVDFAFSDKELDVKPPEVEGIEVMVEKTEILNRKKKPSLLVVTGNVFNNAPVQRSNIILRGQIYDPLGEMRTQARYPCNKTVEFKQLKKSKEGEVADLFLENGAFYNCSIQGESSTTFQLVFEDLPPDYDETFKVKIEPVSARTGK